MRRPQPAEIAGLPRVNCKICNEGLFCLTKVHVAKHDLTQREYCLIWPENANYSDWGTLRWPVGEKTFKNLRREAKQFDCIIKQLKEAEEMEFKNPYWEEKTKIELLQKWIIIHSIIYYQLDEMVAPDWLFDENCKQLTKFIIAHPEAFISSKYYKYFKNWNGSTGFDLFSKLEPDHQSDFKILAMRMVHEFKTKLEENS